MTEVLSTKQEFGCACVHQDPNEHLKLTELGNHRSTRG